MAIITLPNGFDPRPYQLEAYQALDSGIKRVISCWHRRSGKDAAGVHYVAKAAHERVANYWYLFPTQRQARRALWEGVNKQGQRILDQAMPLVLRETTRNDEMMIRFKNGSTFQVTGADQFDALVGSNPAGVVMSEYALTSPQTLRFLLPILNENGGWLWVNSTPRGRNHFYELFETNKGNPKWFVSLKSWKDTGAITEQSIEDDIRAGMPRDLASQEYGCSFEAPNTGAVYAKWIAEARRTGRVGNFPYNPMLPVETAWDLGRDGTSIWFMQRVGSGVHFIDYHQESGTGFHSPAKVVLQKPYAYSRHVGPHDLSVVDFMSDAKRIDQAAQHGIHFTVAPKLLNEDAEPATRAFLGTASFNATTTAQGLAALEHYHREYDEETKTFSKDPKHDWSSHGAKACQYGAVTPGHLGIVPVWAQGMIHVHRPQVAQQQQVPLLGHNGGPPIEAEYDPLAGYRH